MSTKLFIIEPFTLMVLWSAVDIFSSGLASEENCHKCSETLLCTLPKRGLNDVALFGLCGVAVGPVPVMLTQPDLDGSF